MNRYAATGFLTRDPEQRALPSGSTVCQMRLAVKGMGPNYATGYIDVAAFGKLADNCGEYLHKGSQVAVDGRIEHREWDHDGSRRQAHSRDRPGSHLPRPQAHQRQQLNRRRAPGGRRRHRLLNHTPGARVRPGRRTAARTTASRRRPRTAARDTPSASAPAAAPPPDRRRTQQPTPTPPAPPARAAPSGRPAPRLVLAAHWSGHSRSGAAIPGSARTPARATRRAPAAPADAPARPPGRQRRPGSTTVLKCGDSGAGAGERLRLLLLAGGAAAVAVDTFAGAGAASGSTAGAAGSLRLRRSGESSRLTSSRVMPLPGRARRRARETRLTRHGQGASSPKGAAGSPLSQSRRGPGSTCPRSATADRLGPYRSR